MIPSQIINDVVPVAIIVENSVVSILPRVDLDPFHAIWNLECDWKGEDDLVSVKADG